MSSHRARRQWHREQNILRRWRRLGYSRSLRGLDQLAIQVFSTWAPTPTPRHRRAYERFVRGYARFLSGVGVGRQVKEMP